MDLRVLANFVYGTASVNVQWVLYDCWGGIGALTSRIVLSAKRRRPEIFTLDEMHPISPMARSETQLNLSRIFDWQEAEKDRSLVYSLNSEAIQNGTFDPFIIAATTLLHLLVSASRRLLNTDISRYEHTILLICIAAATIEEGVFLLLLISGKDHTSPFFKTFKGFLFMFLNIVLHGIP